MSSPSPANCSPGGSGAVSRGGGTSASRSTLPRGESISSSSGSSDTGSDSPDGINFFDFQLWFDFS